MTLAILALAAALTAGGVATDGAVPKAEVDRTRFIHPTINLMRQSASSRNAIITGVVRTSFAGFSKSSFRCPVLQVSCLCSQNGALVCYRGLWNELETYKPLRKSVVSRAIKDSGVKLTGEDLKKAQTDPQQISMYLPEVLCDRYALSCMYGNPRIKGGAFFRISEPTGEDKLLLVHLEIWQNGVKIGEHESSHSGLGRYGFPKDWYVWKKYPQKFRYVESH